MSWIPVFPPSVSQPVPVISPAVVSGMQPAIPSVGCVATPYVGSHCGEGLLPMPEKLTQKIIRLEFVEMRDLMPETWLMEEEDSRKNMLSFPRKRAAPVTDILQWLQCFAAMVGVLSRAYPTMVPEFMSYQATIIKCARDFHGPAWAQYDRAYRRQVAQTKDLRWSRLNPTLYSLCFAGKAKRLVVCAHCLSDSHATDQCPENMDLGAALMSWQQGATNPATPVGGSSVNLKAKLCFLFNAKEAPGVHSILVSMHIGAQAARVLILAQRVSVQSQVMGRSRRNLVTFCILYISTILEHQLSPPHHQG